MARCFNIIFAYYQKNWILNSLVLAYGQALLINAFGWPLPLPHCVVTYLTGHHCLGCGLNRAAIALLHLDFVRAFHLNPLIYIYSLLLSSWWVIDFKKFHYQYTKTTHCS